jgi:hypothetical protein
MPEVKSSTEPAVLQGLYSVELPYVIVQNEFTQLAPAGQTRQEAPQALLSLVVSTHRPPQSAYPDVQVTLHVVPEHVSVALVIVLHDAQLPLQQIPLDPHSVPSPSSPVEGHVCCPVLHDVVPVWHCSEGVQGLPAVHALQDPW